MITQAPHHYQIVSDALRLHEAEQSAVTRKMLTDAWKKWDEAVERSEVLKDIIETLTVLIEDGYIVRFGPEMQVFERVRKRIEEMRETL